jgi:hypothetical protein
MSDSEFEPDYEPDSPVAPPYEPDETYIDTVSLKEWEIEEGEIVPETVVPFSQLVAQQIKTAHDKYRRHVKMEFWMEFLATK